MNRKFAAVAAAMMVFSAACAGDNDADDMDDMDNAPAVETTTPEMAPSTMPADTMGGMGGMQDTTMMGDTTTQM